MATTTLAVFTIFMTVSIYGNILRNERDVAIPIPKLTCNDIKCPVGSRCQLQNCSSPDICGASICCRSDIIIQGTATSCEPLDFIRNTKMCPRGYRVDRVLSFTNRCCWNVNCVKCRSFGCPSCCISSIDSFGCPSCNCGIVPCPDES